MSWILHLYVLRLVLWPIVFLSNLPSEERRLIRQQTDSTLRQKYKSYFPVGVAVPSKFYKNKQRVELIRKEFASLSPEDQLKPRTVHPAENVYDWSEADSLVSFAETNQMKVRGHCLVWYSRMPSWFYTNQNKIADKKLLLDRMTSHISTVVGRYKGRVYCWDVVNEAVSGKRDEFYRSNDSLINLIGEEYIETAFRAAHRADPSALLFYNDNNFEDVVKRDKIYTLLKRLIAKGVPIHGVGFETHLSIRGTTKGRLSENIEKFASLGLKVQITELDISIYDSFDQNRLMGVREDYTTGIETTQSNMYAMIFKICREKRGKVTGVTVWGLNDGNNYLTKSLKKKNYPYLFDNDLRPKKAYYSIMNF